jgi:beta-carotene hydroxylase
VGVDVLFTLVVGPLLGQVVLVYLFAYVVHRPHTVAGKFVDTSIFELPKAFRGVGTWLWGFQNYHGIHHAFPRVPWYRYRAVFEAHRSELFEQGMPTYQLSGLKWRRIN